MHNIPHLSPTNVYLSSRNATDLNGYGSSVRFPLRKKIVTPANCQAFVSLSSLSYSNLFYNIGPTRQNTVFYYSLSNEISTVLELDIPAGNYNVVSLLEFLNTELADHGFVFTYNDATFRITAECSLFGFIVRDGENSVHRTLGFVVDTPQGTSYTGTHAIDLTGVRAVAISCPNLFLDSNGSGIQTSTLAQVNNGTILGSTISYTATNPDRFIMGENTLNFIDVSLTDENGLPLNFLGSSWCMVLHISYIYTPAYIPPTNNFPTGELIQQTAT